MIVIDASVAVAYLIRAKRGEALFDRIASEDRVAAPTLIDYEIGSALRRICLTRQLGEARAYQALLSMADFSIELHDAQKLAPRAWALRQNMSYYDASYVALAEALEVPLYTLDKKLASAPGHAARIICM